MKNSNNDIENFIKNKLDEGQGLPYNEKHWNAMNDLLEKDMAVSASRDKYKIIYRIASFMFVAIVVVLGMFYFIDEDASIKPDKNNGDKEIVTNKTSKYEKISDKYDKKDNEPINDTQKDFKEKNVSESIDGKAEFSNNNHHTETSKIPMLKLDVKSVSEANTETEINSNKFINETKLRKQSVSGIITLSPKNKLALKTIIGFNKNDFDIALKSFTSIEKKADSLSSAKMESNSLVSNALAKASNKNLINKSAVLLSPYIGMVRNDASIAFTKDNLTYINNAQFNPVYGFDVIYLKRKFNIKSGLSYSTLNFDINYLGQDFKYITDIKYTVVERNYSTLTSGKNIALIKHEIDTVSITSMQKKQNFGNTYSYLSVPLTFQHDYYFKRWNVFAEAGIINHYIISSENNSQMAMLETDKNAIKHIYCFQYLLGMGLNFNFNKRMDVGLHYNYAFTDSKNTFIGNNQILKLAYRYSLK